MTRCDQGKNFGCCKSFAEWILKFFKTEYQKKASEVEGAVEKKKGAAEKDVMEIMGEWYEIFDAGG